MSIWISLGASLLVLLLVLRGADDILKVGVASLLEVFDPHEDFVDVNELLEVVTFEGHLLFKLHYDETSLGRCSWKVGCERLEDSLGILRSDGDHGHLALEGRVLRHRQRLDPHVVYGRRDHAGLAFC